MIATILWAIRRDDGAWLSTAMYKELWVSAPRQAQWWTMDRTKLALMEIQENEEWVVRVQKDGVMGTPVTTGQMLAEVMSALGVW